jgi:glycosyltransferase involved in cell wall biosynthesis
VVILNTADEGGGAERMSLATLDGFEALGTETWLLVGQKRTDHPRVLPLYLSPFLDYRAYESWLQRSTLEWRRRFDRRLGLEDFAHPYSHRVLDLVGSPPDLVLCHNLHGGYFDLRALAPLSRRVPVVLRMFDSWLLTGHCAISLGCSRWQTGCGRCPDLRLPPAIRHDLTRINWWRKRRMLRGARLFVSAETEWMLDRARRSLLAPAVADWRLIPGGVDLDTFSPGCQEAARRELGVALDAHVLLYVANLGPDNPFKDFATVRAALAELARRRPGRRIELLAVGSKGPEEVLEGRILVRRLGYVRSPERLAALYRAADVYVHAALDETFGLAGAEALACGTPVVTASTGGLREIVDHERTGLLLPPGRPVELAEAIVRLLETPSLRAMMGAAAAAAARTRLDRRLMVARLHAWCAEIHASWTP